LADGPTESVPGVRLKESMMDRIKTIFDQDG
jgi:hypothetical protein